MLEAIKRMKLNEDKLTPYTRVDKSFLREIVRQGEQLLKYVDKLEKSLNKNESTQEVLVFPAMSSLFEHDGSVVVGTQNAYPTKNGAFTGEIGVGLGLIGALRAAENDEGGVVLRFEAVIVGVVAEHGPVL